MMRGSLGIGMASSSTPQTRPVEPDRPRGVLARGLSMVGQRTRKPAETPKPPKPQMMRQYELVDRVRRYNPHTDEALLDRAYVYAMKAHGEQIRASGDPYF